MIFVGDTLRAIKDIGIIETGMMFEVTGVMPDGSVIFKNELGSGCLSIDEVGVLVEKVECSERQWSDWKWTHNQFGEYAYRTNGKNVQVELWNGFRSKASCHPDDEFVLEDGIALAFSRASAKFAKTVRKEFDRQHAEMFAV